MQKSERKKLAVEADRIRAQLAAQGELATSAPGIKGKHDPAMVDALRGRLEEVNRLLAAG